MKRRVFMLLSLATLVACSSSPGGKFLVDGISFVYEEGWAVTDQEDFDGQGYYVSLEKDGINSSGLFVLTWLYDSLDQDESLEKYKEELKNNIIYRNSDLEFTKPVDDEFSGIPSRSVRFTLGLLGVDHEGVIHVFYGPDFTVFVMKQEAI
ncbi:MAG: hypothetical protein RIE59_19195, partial [Imperialibacter sp.]